MKFELRYRGGKLDTKTKKWETEWDFGVEARTVFTSGIKIGYVGSHTDCIVIDIKEIPARVDLDDNGSAWLHTAREATLFPEPYTSLPNQTSRTIWEQGKQEVKDKH